MDGFKKLRPEAFKNRGLGKMKGKVSKAAGLGSVSDKEFATTKGLGLLSNVPGTQQYSKKKQLETQNANELTMKKSKPRKSLAELAAIEKRTGMVVVPDLKKRATSLMKYKSPLINPRKMSK